MSVIILPHKWQRAPEQPVEIDWSNPLCEGLVFATPLGIPGWGYWFDPIQRQMAIPTATNLPTSAVGDIGRVAKFESASSQGLKIVKAPVSSIPLTLSAVFFNNGLGASRAICAYGNQSGSSRAQLYETVISGQIGAFYLDSAGNIGESLITGVPTGRYIHAAGVFASSTARIAYANGKSGTINTTPVSGSLSPTGISYGARCSSGSWGLYANQGIQIPKMWGRELSESEVRADRENPWQIFRPLQRRIYVGPSAGGGLTSTGALTASAPTLAGTATKTGNLTSSGALTTDSPILAGTAHFVHDTSGTDNLQAGTPTLAGTATAVHNLTSTGALATDSPILSGTATVTASGSITSSGALTTGAPTLAGTATKTGNLTSSGALTAGSPTLAGTATKSSALTSSGALLAGAPTLAGTATAGEAVSVDLIYKLLANRQELNATTGKFIIYDDDDVTPLLQADAWEDAAGTIAYRGNALRRIDRLA